ncbi:MAG: type IX secretion system sortase PorU [Bacteroidales bacterium]|nr:type IX secretion system sortase PorU [Bacteroidales bacterium]
MKKYHLIFILFFINSLLTAQVVYISDSLKWQSNKIFIDNDNNTWNILSFDNAQFRSDDNLPVYFHKSLIKNDGYVADIELVRAEYEVINKEELAKVKNINNLLDIPQIKAEVTKFRKQSYISFELIPLRRNKMTGEIERLVNFEYKIQINPSLVTRAQKTYTYDSKLSSGSWYKIRVSETGIYKLAYSDLVSMGFSSFNNIGVFGYGGMLPKTLGDELYDDLPERPLVKVDVNNNAVFDNGDYLLFFADGPHNISWSTTGVASHEFHSYSTYAYYFVSDQGSWKQPVNQASLATYDVEITTFDDYAFLEKDSINLLHSGRQLFWREFDYYLSHSFSKSFANVSTNDTAIVKVMLAARSNSMSYFNLIINGINQGNLNIDPTTNSSLAVYAKSNSVNTFKFKPNSSVFSVNLTYTKTSTNSKGWLDYISFQVRRQLAVSNNFVQFRDTKSVSSGVNARFKITNAGSTTIVWDITDRISVKSIQGSLSGSTYSFNADASELREYIAFNPVSSFPVPEISGVQELGIAENQNLHSVSPVDLIIVSNPDYLSQAQTIKQIHESYDDMSVFITTPQKIYNEFSSGTPDVTSIRNFMKMLYDRASSEDEIPQNLLLLGDGSYDNLGIDPLASNLILTYQSESSVSPTSSYVSDDFFVFLDDGEGSVNGSHDIDVGVGRIPVKTVAEAEAYVNKLQNYYSSTSYGAWKNKLLLISDDAEGGETIHQTQSATLGLQIEADFPVFNIEKMFLDDYEQVSTVQGHKYPDVNQAITDNINNGVLLVNWIGHGNEKGWAHESVLTLSMITSWQNANKYPIFITATCEFSPWDHHDLVSAGEEVLLNPNGGGISLFTTTRLAFSSSNASLSYKFYEEVFLRDENGDVYPIGLSAIKAKNSLIGDTNKRVFSLLGDPAMRPSVPSYVASTTKINGVDVAEFNDTIQATAMVTFEGIITDPAGNLAENFNGIIYPTVYDKRMEYTTRGNDGYTPLTYTAQKNIIFNGQASVVNGKFTFSFIVPIDIAYFYDEGKVSYYAHNNSDTEAAGYDGSFLIGGSAGNELNDNEGPIIDLFMNNEQFIPGGITDENPLLLAKIEDESGINTVGSGIGHDITLIFDENTADVIVLNKFYESTIDDFTSGEVNYNMSELALGPHTLKVKAWDVLNNSGEAYTDFIVANSAELVIDHIFNYPNPFSTSTNFYFDHNQPNQMLDVIIQVFTVAGKHVKTIEDVVMSDGFRSQPIHWDGKDEYGDKIGKGVYVYKIKVRSAAGNVVEEFEKLVILN